jgi:hypothetical protein
MTYTFYKPHSTVMLTNPSGTHPFREYPIDSLLVKHIQVLWAQGIETWSSCQGSDFHPGYISGPQLRDLPLATNILKEMGLIFVDDEPAEEGLGWLIWFVPLTEAVYQGK